MAAPLEPPSAFNFGLGQGNLSSSWKKWEKQFRTYYCAAELTKKDKETQVAILLHVAGPEAQEIHETFVFADDADKTDYQKVLKKFKDYCEPRTNVVFERYKFWDRNQAPDESVGQWVMDLTNRAASCEFGGQKDSMLRDKIVFGVHDSRVKERLLREPDLTLAKALEVCRAAESSRQHIKAMSAPAAGKLEVHAISSKSMSRGNQSRGCQSRSRQPRGRQVQDRQSHGQSHGQQSRGQQSRGQQQHAQSSQGKDGSSSVCQFCKLRHEPGKCPAYGKRCLKCHRYNHFASACAGKAVKQVHSVDELQQELEQDLFIGHLFIGDVSTRKDDDWWASISVDSATVDVPMLFPKVSTNRYTIPPQPQRSCSQQVLS